MANLIVLSEINNLSYLNSIGIIPYEFYTDLTSFKERSSIFDNAEIVIILAGTCAFSKKHVIELYNTLLKRSANTKDLGVASVILLSDTKLPSCSSYYLFKRDFKQMSLYSEWKFKELSPDIIDSIKKKSFDGNTVTYLSNYDKCDDSKLIEKIRSNRNSEDDLKDLIKVPEALKISD